MKKNFVAFVLFLLMFGAIPISCDILCFDSCGCGNNAPPKDFSIKNFDVKDFLMGQTLNPDFYYPKDDFYKLIEVSDFEFLSQTGYSIPGAGFIQIAKACSPPPNQSKESITGIRVRTKKQFVVSPEENIEIGSDISGYFLISNYPSNLAETISDYLKVKPKIYLGHGLFLKWNSSLVENLELVFDIEIELSNGKIFVFDDEKMKLLK